MGDWSDTNKSVRRLRKKLRQVNHLRALERELNEEETLKVAGEAAMRTSLLAMEKLLRSLAPPVELAAEPDPDPDSAPEPEAPASAQPELDPEPEPEPSGADGDVAPPSLAFIMSGVAKPLVAAEVASAADESEAARQERAEKLESVALAPAPASAAPAKPPAPVLSCFARRDAQYRCQCSAAVAWAAPTAD